MQNKIKNLIKKLSRFGFHVKPSNSRHMDPVCGMEATNDIIKASYNGKDYYFCSEHCKGEFVAKPQEYIH